MTAFNLDAVRNLPGIRWLADLPARLREALPRAGRRLWPEPPCKAEGAEIPEPDQAGAEPATAGASPSAPVRPVTGLRDAKGMPDKGLEAAQYGIWTTLSTLLNELDEYFACLRAVRGRDRRALAMYQEIGGLIAAPNHIYEMRVSPYWNQARPAWGFSFFPYTKHQRPKVPCRLAYAHKVTDAYVEKARGDTYKLTVWWIDPSDKYYDVDVCHVELTPEGDVRLLKERRIQRIPLPRGGVVVRPEWGYPPFLGQLCIENKADNAALDTPEDLAKFLFCVISQNTELADAGALVRVKRHGITAAFAIDVLKTPHFFKDRDLTVTVNGKRRKIFHITRTHFRTLPDGRQVPVRTHFRGERKFSWKGYDVIISMPGLHHNLITAFAPALTAMSRWRPVPKGFITERKAAEQVAAYFRGDQSLERRPPKTRKAA